MMMMIAKVHLMLLPCRQAEPAEGVRSGRQDQEMGLIPKGAAPFLSH
jgi:hypothetical protein